MKIALGLCMIAGTATAANAITLSAAPIGGAGYSDRALSAVYTGIPGPYAAFGAATGSMGFDDYQTSNLADNFTTIGSVRFVGGVTAVGGIVDFNFFDSTGTTLLNSFNVQFGQAGNFIWTIGLGTVANANMDSTFSVPTNGILQLSARAGTTGQWFLTPTAPTVGTNALAFGGGAPTRNNAFELNAIPAPGALALLGLGGIVAGRRRR